MRGEVGKNWHDLGIELLESNDVGGLNTIEAEHSSDLKKCCTKMFELWLKKQAYSIMEPVDRSLKAT